VLVFYRILFYTGHMTEIKPRFEVPLGISGLPPGVQKQQVHALQQLSAEDPRMALSIQLKMTRKVLNAIEERLQQSPQDAHQLYLQEVHTQRESQLLDALRLENTDRRYQRLEAWVNQKVQQLDPEGASNEVTLSAEEMAAQNRLREEQKTWQTLIQKVRERLVKKPGDVKLMQLLAEHQSRLLRLQEQLRQQQHKIEDEALVLTQFEKPLESIAREETPERVRLQREIEMREALCEKTRQRLMDKPELLHLKALITQHEVQIKTLRESLQAL
jgi:hypothetical protein